MRSWILPLLIFAACPASAQTPAPPSLETQAAANMARGDLLYAYDQSAWHVTDAALAAIPKLSMNLVRGYVVSPAEGGYRTTFYGGETGPHYRLYSAIWTGDAITSPDLAEPDRRIPLTADEERLIAARELALRNATGLKMCNDSPPNVAVIPGSTPADPISVYIMTPQTKTGELPMGGHHRIDIKDGAVVAKRDFANSCINGSKEAKSSIISHLLDPVPTEIHAFTMLSTQRPLYVLVPGRTLFLVGRKNGKTVTEVVKANIPAAR